MYKIRVPEGTELEVMTGKHKGLKEPAPVTWVVVAKWLPMRFAFDFTHPGNGYRVRVQADKAESLGAAK